MKYKNKFTGVIVEPSCEVAAQSFTQSPDWQELKELTRGSSNDKANEKANASKG